MKWGLFFLSIIMFGFWLFYTDKRAPSGSSEIPLGWLSDNLLLTAEDNKLFLREPGKSRDQIYALSSDGLRFVSNGFCISKNRWWLPVWRFKTDGSISSASNSGALEIEIAKDENGRPRIGSISKRDWLDKPEIISCSLDTEQKETTKFLRASESYQKERKIQFEDGLISLENQAHHFRGGNSRSKIISAPHGGMLYLHESPLGLTKLVGDKVSVHIFPDAYREAVGDILWHSEGYTIFDRGLNKALFVQNGCSKSEYSENCTRKALWLSDKLEGENFFEIPEEPLIEIKSGYSCFSCGCGCYAYESLYAENGKIYLHVWGYPVVDSLRGVYRLKETKAGPTWEKIVSGQVQSPIAVSADGKKIAYFTISWFGDEFKVVNLGS